MLPRYAGKPKEFEGKHSELSKRIIKVFYDVHNELGFGFSEKVYQKSYAIALRQDGMKVDEQVQIKVYFRGQLVRSWLCFELRQICDFQTQSL